MADDEPEAAATEASEGFPRFEHNQWTIEGEIERFGAFGRGGARASGPKRWLAIALVAALLLTIAFAVVLPLVQALT